MSNNDIYRVKSIERALLILETVSQYEDGVKISDLAEKLDVNLSTTHRIASFLRQQGYLEQDAETKKYYLGLKVLELQGFLMNRLRVVDSALPEMKKIAYELGETVHLGILSDGDVVYVESLQGANSMISESRIGRRAAVHSTALGKSLVAWRPWGNVQEILQKKGMNKTTPYTIDNEMDFQKELELVRAQGYAIDRNEQSMISRCISVPIWNYRNEVEAALSVSFATHELGKKEEGEIYAFLLGCAQEISKRMGHV